MDNIITGIIGVSIFLAFVLGLGVSIGTVPFGIIVVIVSILLITDFYESVKKARKQEKDRAGSD
ncbi:MAG: hypothetical protein IIC58_08315 [Proteobacteria bacterium]|nr:hypothetical protein [Pseudomonadota bacterium]